MSIYTKTIGWIRLKSDEMATSLARNVFEESPSTSSARQMGVFRWQWDLRARQTGLAEQRILLQEALKAELTSQGEFYSALNKIIESMIPKELGDQLAMAISYAEKDDMIGKIISTQRNFGLSGFRVAAQDDKVQQKVRAFNLKNCLPAVLREIYTSLSACDAFAVVFHKKTETMEVLPLGLVRTVSLHQVDSKTGRPLFRTFLKPSEEFRKYVKALIRSAPNNPEAKSQLLEIPIKYVEAVQRPSGGRKISDPLHPSGYVELKEKDDEYVYIANLKGLQDQLSTPSMVSIFPSIELRQMLQEGEISISYTIKHFIHQIRVGPSPEVAGGLQQALRYGKVSPKDKKAIRDDYAAKLDKVILEVTDQFLEHRFYFPGADVDIFSKYGPPEKRICWWGGISEQIIVGERGTYSGGLVYLKGFRAAIKQQRSLISEFLEWLYSMAPSINKAADVQTEWDEHFMKEARQLLSEVTFLSQHGMPMEQASDILGYNYRQWVSLKEQFLPLEIREMKDDKERQHEYWTQIETPVFEPNQGLLEPGRPAIDDTQTDDEQQPREPRPSVEE